MFLRPRVSAWRSALATAMDPLVVPDNSLAFGLIDPGVPAAAEVLCCVLHRLARRLAPVVRMGRQGTSHRVLLAISSSIAVAGVFARLVLPRLPVILSPRCRGLEQVGRLYHKAVLTVAFPLQPHALALRRGDRRRQRLLVGLWVLQQPVEAVATPLEPETARDQQQHCAG